MYENRPPSSRRGPFFCLLVSLHRGIGKHVGAKVTAAALVTGRWWWLIVARVVGYAFA